MVHEGPRFSVERFVDGVPVAGSPVGRRTATGSAARSRRWTRPCRNARTFACGDYHLVSCGRFDPELDPVRRRRRWCSRRRGLPTRVGSRPASWSDDVVRCHRRLRVDDDGRVSETRRVATAVRGWTHGTAGMGTRRHASPGCPATRTASTRSIGLLRPGSSEPRAIDLESGLQLINPRWSNDGRVLVAVGKSGPGRGSGIYVVDPVSLTVEAIDLKVRPLADKYAWEFGSAHVVGWSGLLPGLR